MRHAGLIVNLTKPHAAEAVRRVARMAAALELTLHADRETAALAESGAPIAVCTEAEFSGRVEAVVALGGDGTFLDAAHRIQGSCLPLMGLNIGSLGYLTSVDEGRFKEALRCLREDRYQIGARSVLASRIRRAGGGVETVPLNALNDVVVSRGASGRLVRLELALDGVPVTTYVCDGLIVATPTGSTAYSLAAGGPIVMADARVLAICVICPHALGARPLVVADSSRVVIRVIAAQAPLLLSIDGGDDLALCSGDGVEIERGPHDVRVAFLPEHDPYAVLSRKLGWGGRALQEKNNSPLDNPPGRVY